MNYITHDWGRFASVLGAIDLVCSLGVTNW